MWALIRLLASTYFKSPGWLMGYITPTLFLGIFATTINDPTGATFTASVASVLTITLITQGIMMFGFNLIELRKSVIFKRIGSTAITKPKAMMSFFTWTFISTGLIVGYTLFLTAIFDISNIASFNWGDVKWEGVIPMMIVGLATALAISFLFVTISSNIETFNMYAMLYFFLATFVGGLFFPGANPDWMTWVGKFIPHVYISNNISYAFQGYNIYNVVDGFDVVAGALSSMGGNVGDPINGIFFEFDGSAEEAMEAFQIAIANQNGWDVAFLQEGSSLIKTPTADRPNLWALDGVIIGTNNISISEANLGLWIPIGTSILAFLAGAKLFKWDAK